MNRRQLLKTSLLGLGAFFIPKQLLEAKEDIKKIEEPQKNPIYIGQFVTLQHPHKTQIASLNTIFGMNAHRVSVKLFSPLYYEYPPARCNILGINNDEAIYELHYYNRELKLASYTISQATSKRYEEIKYKNRSIGFSTI